MRLNFSEQEKASFLEKRGFEIKRMLCEREEHIHGSAFRTVLYYEVVAVFPSSGISGKIEVN